MAKPIKNLRWYICGLLMLATTVNYLDRQTLSVAKDTITGKFHMTDSDYANITNGFLFAYLIGQPLCGWVIDRLRTRRGMTLCVVWWSIANMLHMFASSVLTFTGFRFLLGIGEGGNFPGAVKTTAEWFPPKERTVATGWYNVGAGLGALIAPGIVAFLILYFDRWDFGWQAAFLVTGATGFIWVALWLWLYRSPEDHPRLSPEEFRYIRSDSAADAAAQATHGTWWDVLRTKNLWVLMLVRFMTDPVWWFYVFWLPTYLKTDRGLDLKTIGLLAGLPFLAGDFGSIMGGYLSAFFVKRGFTVLNARKLSLACCAALMPFAIPAVRVHSLGWALLFVSCATLGHQAWAASVLTLPADLFPRHLVGRAYGPCGAAASLGGMVMTKMVGWILDFHWGIGAMSGYVLVFTIIGVMHPLGALVAALFLHPAKDATPGDGLMPAPAGRPH